MVLTDYAAHEKRYQQLRAAGAPGWATTEDYAELDAELGWLLAAGASSGTRVLEIGCGAGNIAERLVEHGFDVTGIDISPTAVDWARERSAGRARFIVGNVVERIDGEYDLVVDGHCLHCIIGADRARVLANVRGALAPGGSFFVSTMCGDITSPALRASFDPVTRCQIVDGVAYRYIGDAAAILDEVRAAGLDIMSSQVRTRTDDSDQDSLWALARRR